MTYNKKKIGNRIYKNRDKLGLTLEQLAELSGVSRQSISNYESGKTIPTEAIRRKLCKAFNCDMGYLMCEYDTKTRKHADIAEETGLSDKAILGLKAMYKPTLKGGDNRPLDTVNFLLENFVTGDSEKLLTAIYDCFQLDYQIPVFFNGDGFKPPAHSNRLERSINYTTSGSPKLHLSKKEDTNDAIPVQIDKAFLETVLMNRIKDVISILRKEFCCQQPIDAPRKGSSSL